MHMKHGADFVTCGRDVKFCLRGRESRLNKSDLCSMMCTSPDAKVQGILTMLSPMKPRKKFDRITGTAFFHRVSYHLLQSLSTVAFFASQWTTTHGWLLHSFAKHDGSCKNIYIYMQTLAYSIRLPLSRLLAKRT